MPRSIMWSTYANAFLGLIMVFTLIFTMGDLEQIAQTPTGYPFIQVFLNATGSKAGTTVMTLCIILPLTGSVIACIATASRQIWSFARDQGIPFSGTIRHVSPPYARSNATHKLTFGTGLPSLEHPSERRTGVAVLQG